MLIEPGRGFVAGEPATAVPFMGSPVVSGELGLDAARGEVWAGWTGNGSGFGVFETPDLVIDFAISLVEAGVESNDANGRGESGMFQFNADFLETTVQLGEVVGAKAEDAATIEERPRLHRHVSNP